MTSDELAKHMCRAECRWQHTALRARLHDHYRLEWKRKFVARTITLFQHWRGSIKRGPR